MATDEPEARFWRPTPKRRRRRATTAAAARILRVAGGIVAGLVAVAAGAFGYASLLDSPHLDVTEVRFSGGLRTPVEHLGAIRGEVLGQNILAVDLTYLEARLRRAEPWIRATTIRRVFPDQIAVTLVEHEALARVLPTATTAATLLTDRGQFLPAEPELPTDSSLPTLTVADGTPEAARMTAVELLELLDRGRHPLGPRVAHVDLTDPENAVLQLDDAPYAIHLGRLNLASKLNRYRNVEPLLSGRYDDLRTVDLRFRDRVVVAPVAGRTLTDGRG